MNKPAQQELWEKIQNFQLDDPTSAFPFSKKLALKNHWEQPFVNKAITEYKKFIFLCCISPTGASPSPIVDEVWHLHLTYTDSYWNSFCKQTLQKEIHHHPSKGGNTEKEKHIDWYQQTLQLYEASFDSKPPTDIWPGQTSTSDIDEKIYEPAYLKWLTIIFTAVTILFIVLVDLFHTKGPDFLQYYLFICFAALVAIFIAQKHKDQRLKTILENNIPEKYSVYQVARFLYGSHRCYQTALVDLLRRNIITTHGNDYRIVQYPLDTAAKEDNPLLLPLTQNLKEGDVFTYTEGLGLIDSDTVLHPGFERLHRFSKKVDYPKFIIPGFVLFIGFARFLQGLANDKPVAFLVLEMMAFGMLSLAIMGSFSYTQTVRKHLGIRWQEQNNNGYGSNTINNFTILGVTAIAGVAEYGILKNVFDAMVPKEKNSSGNDSAGCGSSSDSSCSGGSSCSSGCGGCGGGD